MEIHANDATAIMDMLARHAADDTNWDEAPLLFALGRTPEGVYGIAPARPWTGVMLDAFEPGVKLRNILAAFPDMMERHQRMAPGLDMAWVALRVEFEETDRQWFPDITEGTEPVGIILRNEGWAKLQEPGETEIPKGSLADDPASVEVLMWQAVTYDEQFCQVVWTRGEASPRFETWSFKGDHYREHKDMQAIPTALRAMMRVSRSVLIEKRLQGKSVGV